MVFNAALVLVAERWALEDEVEIVLASLRVELLIRAVALRWVVLLIRPEAFLWEEAVALWV